VNCMGNGVEPEACANTRCVWVYIDDLLRAKILRPSLHRVGAFEARHLLTANRLSTIRYDADMVDAGKDWVRMRYDVLDSRTGVSRRIDLRVALSRTRRGGWLFAERGGLHERVCLVHPGETAQCIARFAAHSHSLACRVEPVQVAADSPAGVQSRFAAARASPNPPPAGARLLSPEKLTETMVSRLLVGAIGWLVASAKAIWQRVRRAGTMLASLRSWFGAKNEDADIRSTLGRSSGINDAAPARESAPREHPETSSPDGEQGIGGGSERDAWHDLNPTSEIRVSPTPVRPAFVRKRPRVGVTEASPQPEDSRQRPSRPRRSRASPDRTRPSAIRTQARKRAAEPKSNEEAPTNTAIGVVNATQRPLCSWWESPLIAWVWAPLNAITASGGLFPQSSSSMKKSPVPRADESVKHSDDHHTQGGAYIDASAPIARSTQGAPRRRVRCGYRGWMRDRLDRAHAELLLPIARAVKERFARLTTLVRVCWAQIRGNATPVR